MVRPEKPMLGDRPPFGERVLDTLSGSSVHAYTFVSIDQWDIIRSGIGNLNRSLSAQRAFNGLTESWAQQLPIGRMKVQASYAQERTSYIQTVHEALAKLNLYRYMGVRPASISLDGKYHLVSFPNYSVRVESVKLGDGKGKRTEMKKISIAQNSPEATRIQNMVGGHPSII